MPQALNGDARGHRDRGGVQVINHRRADQREADERMAVLVDDRFRLAGVVVCLELGVT